MVSRQFLIQQATLNALDEWMPNIVRLDGAAAAARRVMDICGAPDLEGHWLYRDVRKHFKLLDRRQREAQDVIRLDSWREAIGSGIK